MPAKFSAAEFMSQETTLPRLKGLVKVQLSELATHLGLDVSKCSKKKEIFEVVGRHLGLNIEKEDDVAQQQTSAGSVDATQIELAKLELEKEKLKAENLKLQQEIMKQQIELTQAQASSSQSDSDRPSVSRIKGPDIAKMANSIPRFNEEDVDSFFYSFERVAKNLEWETKYWSMVVQQKLTGKAHVVVSALADEDANDLMTIKQLKRQFYWPMNWSPRHTDKNSEGIGRTLVRVTVNSRGKKKLCSIAG